MKQVCRSIFVVLLVSAIAGAPVGCRPAAKPPTAGGVTGVVTLKFDSGGDAVATLDVPDVADGTTLEAVMRDIDEMEIELTGSGTTAFVKSIDGISMEASQGWTFTVDGEFATQGIGATTLHPPTTVEWSFGEMEF